MCEAWRGRIRSKDFCGSLPFAASAEKSACCSSYLHSALSHRGFQTQKSGLFPPNGHWAPQLLPACPSPLPACLQVNCGQVLGGPVVGILSSTPQKPSSPMWTRPLARLHPSRSPGSPLPPPRLAQGHFPGGLRDPAAGPSRRGGPDSRRPVVYPRLSSPSREATDTEWTRRSPRPGLAPPLTARRPRPSRPRLSRCSAGPALRPDRVPARPVHPRGLAWAGPGAVLGPQPAPPSSPAP